MKDSHANIDCTRIVCICRGNEIRISQYTIPVIRNDVTAVWQDIHVNVKPEFCGRSRVFISVGNNTIRVPLDNFLCVYRKTVDICALHRYVMNSFQLFSVSMKNHALKEEILVASRNHDFNIIHDISFHYIIGSI